MSRPGSRHSSMLSDNKRTRSFKILLKILWQYLKPFTGYLILIALLTLFYTAAVTAQPLIVEKAIDQLLVGDKFDAITTLVIIYFALSILSWMAQSANTWFMSIVSNRLVHSLRTATFEGLVKADMNYHATNQSGDVTSRVIGDTQEITNGLAVFTTTLTNLLVALTTLIVLFSISIWFGLISLLALPTAFGITKIIASRGKQKMLEVRSSMGKVSGKLAENLNGVAIAKSFNQEDRTSEEIRKLNDETFGYFKQLGFLFTMIFPSITLVSMLMIMGVLLVGGYLNEAGIITLGAIYLGTIMVRRFLSPIMALSNNITNFQASLAALDRVTDVLESRPSVKNSPDARPLGFSEGEIQVDNISFAYSGKKRMNGAVKPDMRGKMNAKMQAEMQAKMKANMKPDMDAKMKAEMKAKMQAEMQAKMKANMKARMMGNSEDRNETIVLKNVSFTIPAGKKTAIVGHTGAGKTTITKLLLRFYDPKDGSIMIDGQDLREITLESLYDTISLVSQEPYLFVGSVVDNIKYGNQDVSDEQVYKICEMLGADQFIEALPDGYETKLIESGKSLSAGQRQMITIARTMIRDPKILILDEATSRLDAFTESLVQEAQNKLFEGRTTVIIAHRLSTIRDVDQIIVMDDGSIVEQGTHDELMRLKGKYFELYNTYYAHQGISDIKN